MAKLSDKISDVQVREALRRLEAKGLIWSEIDADGKLRFYATEHRPKPINTTDENNES